MKSRMDRYYQSATGTSRETRNKELYNERYDGDYDLKSYSNVEGVASIDKNNQIDLEKLQDLLKKREIQRMNEAPHLVKRNVEQRKVQDIEEEKNYDIKEILSQAHNEKGSDSKTRNLSNTSYDILRKLNVKEVEDEDRKLRELIDSVTSTDIINKLADKDLGLDMLNDLKSDNGTTIMSPIELKDDIKKQSDLYKDNLGEIDNSFYTTSLGFTQSDFEDLRDIQESIKANNKLIKILVIILIAALIAGVIFLLII